MIQKEGKELDVIPDRVIKQKQSGLYAVKYHPLCGNMSLDKWKELYDVVQDMDEVELRLTPQEDIYIVNLNGNEVQKY